MSATSDQIHIAIILGSTREGRLSDSIGHWAAGELKQNAGISCSVIDPRDLDSPFAQTQNQQSRSELKQQLARADAFLVITPEYNHSFPAALKALIDSAYDEWQTKPVGFISYGGLAGGTRAVEQLRQVFAELHAVTVRDQLSFINVWEQWAGGQLKDARRAHSALKRVREQLIWWARASKHARVRQAYPIG